MNKQNLFLCALILLYTLLSTNLFSQQTEFSIQTDYSSGGIQKIMNKNDLYNMNWVFTSDGSLFKWQIDEFAWGLGHVTLTNGSKTETFNWKKVSIINTTTEGIVYEYKFPDFKLSVIRTFNTEGDFTETYRFENTCTSTIKLENIGIYTTFYDNYLAGSKICQINNCNAHVWTGNNSSYINAVRMGGEAPHLGLVLTEGNVENYEIINVIEDKEEKGYSKWQKR